MSDLVDQLLASPGLYVGPQSDPSDASGRPLSSARVRVTALPGACGVLLEYEVLSATNGLVHWEQAMLARTVGGLVLVTAHTHAPVAVVLHETERGSFPATADDVPFPMAIRLEVPEPGHLIYTWSYGEPGGEARVRDVGDLRLVGSQ